jgi:hypothetical protein
MSEDRRNFINRAGKVAIATPPVLALLLKAEGRHYAQALSGSPTGGGSASSSAGAGASASAGASGSASNGSSSVNAGVAVSQ